MATAVQQRRGTNAQHDDGSGFTGLEGELTVDTTNDTVRVHDGSLKGGHRLAKHSELGATITAADESSDTTCFPVFTTDATGALSPKTDASAYTYNAGTGALSATTFIGAFTGNVTGNAATATIAKGAAVIHNQSTDGSTIGHADVAGYVGKTVIYTNTGDGDDLTLGVPQCPEDVDIGEQIHLVNASTGDGSTANIVFDLDEVSGDPQNINICTGASVVDVGTTNPHIIAGGVATLVAVAANEYILFGSGVVDN